MDEKRLDCMLVHAPKFDNWYKPLGDFIWINYLPIGIFALADNLEKHGYKSEIVHLGIEWIEDHNFDIVEYVGKIRPRVVALSLHWHYQSYDVIKVAEAIKARYPDIFVCAGGFTASYYHKEIPEDFPSLDAVIRGDAEEPLLRLVEHVTKNKRDLHTVPNLTWRSNGKVVENEAFYCATEEQLNALRFTNLPLLKNHKTYVNYFGHPFMWKKSFSKKANFHKLSIGSKTLPLSIGRGCPMTCTWCAGSILSQRFITRRTKPIYRSIDKILESIQEALSYGYETMYVVFDPYPDNQGFFIELFAKIREYNIQCEMVFECHGLPTKPFMDAFHATFPHEESFLCISPETGSERLRRMHKHRFYSNEELLDCLRYLEELGVNSEVFFTYGIPGETLEELQETIKLKRFIKRNFKRVHCIRVLSIEMEPGSPWHMDPKKYGIVHDRPHFRDFYRAHSSKYNQTYSSLGYFIPNYFPDNNGAQDIAGFEQALQRIKCKYFCFLGPNARKSGPAWTGRLFCNTLSLMDRLKGKKARADDAAPLLRGS
ncbi:MAG: radical SAM protein [Deltaproteobacteria bacterium]|nr:radical SAM protein [Deltaproteobacteria bacterium]